jgi:hypothetical protein
MKMFAIIWKLQFREIPEGGTMKAFISGLLIFISAGVVFAQDFPVAGNWRLQIIGTAEEFSVEIDNAVWTFEMEGSKIPQLVTVDNDKKTLVIPLLVALADYYFFEIKDGYIDLKAGGKFNFPMLESIRGGMTEMEGINEVTDDFIERIIIEIESAFYTVPILRLYQD